jgi:hypothetical protein
MKTSQLLMIVIVLLVGYVIGVKYPSLPYASALANKI